MFLNCTLRKRFALMGLLLLTLCCLPHRPVLAQTFWGTIPQLQPQSSMTGMMSFQLESNTDVYIDTLYCRIAGSSGNFTVWRSSTSLTGQPFVNNPAQNWEQIVTDYRTTAGGNLSAEADVVAIPLEGSLYMPANSPQRFVVWIQAGQMRFTNGFSFSIPVSFTNGTLTLLTGGQVTYIGNLANPNATANQVNAAVFYRPATGRDMRLLSLLSPQTLGATPAQIRMRVQNSGADTLFSAEFNYRIDGGPVANSGLVNFPQPLLAGQSFDYTFPASVPNPASGQLQLELWHSNVNGLGPDAVPGNDSLSLNLCTGLAGTYQVGGAGADFSDLEAAFAALYSCGMTDSVVLALAAGTYYGPYFLGPIPGDSSLALTLQSSSLQASSVVLTQDSSVTGNPTIFNSNSNKRIQFRQLSFVRTRPGALDFQPIVHFESFRSRAEVSLCRFIDQTLSPNSLNIGLQFLGSHGLFAHNTYEGFWGPLILLGQGSQANQIINNSFTGFFGTAIRTEAQADLLIRGNQIMDFAGFAGTAPGIVVTDVVGLELAFNTIGGFMSGMGIQIQEPIQGQRPAGVKSRIYNNIIDGRPGLNINAQNLSLRLLNIIGRTAATNGFRDALEIAHNTIRYQINSTISFPQAAIWVTGPFNIRAWDSISIVNNHIEISPIDGVLPANAQLLAFGQPLDTTAAYINHNNYFSAGQQAPGPVRIGFNPGILYPSLAAWQQASQKDGQSVAMDAGFGPGGLLIPSNPALDNRGLPIASIPTDITGQTRNSTTPDIGAVEFTGLILSQINPILLGDTLLGNNRWVSAEITDTLSTLVPGSARLRYKKSTQQSWQTDSLPLITGSNHRFLIDYTLLGGVQLLDTIQYYFAVQNAAGQLTTAPAGGSGMLPGPLIDPDSSYSYSIITQLAGTYRVGTSGPADFATLSLASKAFNSAIINGPVVFILIDSLYDAAESFPINFRYNPGVSAQRPVRVLADSSRQQVRITGIAPRTNGLINVDGLSHFTLAGADSLRKLQLVFKETTLERVAVVQVSSVPGRTVSNINLLNLDVWGTNPNAETSYGIILGSRLADIAFFGDSISNVRIENVDVQRTNGGIIVLNQEAAPGSQLIIRHCRVGAELPAHRVQGIGISVHAMQTASITDNEISYIGGSPVVSFQTGMQVSGNSTQNVAISRNKIHHIHNNHQNGGPARGMFLDVGSQVTVSNNLIYDIRSSGTLISGLNQMATALEVHRGTQYGIYYNSILLADGLQQAVPDMPAACGFLVTNSSATGSFINNVVGVNISRQGGGQGIYHAIGFPTSFNFTNFNLNNNAYWVANRADHHLGRQGTSSTGLYPELASWRVFSAFRNANNETQSIPTTGKQAPPLQAAAALRPATGLASLMESGAAVIPALGLPNTDIDGRPRPAFNGTAPDMGAYEFDGIRAAYLPNTLDSFTISPPESFCGPVSRHLTVYVSNTNPVLSARLLIAHNGAAQPSLAMQPLSSTVQSVWEATVPPAPTNDSLQLQLELVNVVGDTLFQALGSYVDQEIRLSLGADTSIFLGDSLTIEAGGNFAVNTRLSNLAAASTAVLDCAGGFMFELLPSLPIELQAIDLLPQFSGPQQVKVYYRLGPKAGFQADSSSWTTAGVYAIQVDSTSPVHLLTLSNPIAAGAGQQLSIYLQYHSRYAAGPDSLQDDVLQLRQAEALCTAWSAGQTAVSWVGRLHYRVTTAIQWQVFNAQWPQGQVLVGGNSLQLAPRDSSLFVASTALGSCVVVDSQWVAVQEPNNHLQGVLQYDNSVRSPIANSLVTLRSGGLTLQTSTTNAAGAFVFSGPFDNGFYELTATPNLIWGGVNATDALRTARHFAGLSLLSGLRRAAADVNASQTINATDALEISRRFSEPFRSFNSGDWLRPARTVQLRNDSLSVSLLALAYGDVNGSYLPVQARRQSSVDLVHQGQQQLGSRELAIPLQLVEAATLGAVSLAIALPQGLRVHRVKSLLKGGDFQHAVSDGQLIISWFSLEALPCLPGQTLFELWVSAEDGFEAGRWTLGAESELADGWAEPLEGLQLRMPALVATAAAFDLWLAPNPATAWTQLNYRLPQAGEIQLRLTNAQGTLVREQRHWHPAGGLFTTELRLAGLAAGIYQLQLRYDYEGGWAYKSVKLVVVEGF